MTAFDLRHIPPRRALEGLVERCIERDDVLVRCLEKLTPEVFARDYDLRIAFYSLAGKLAKGTYDPKTNRRKLVEGLAALDLAAYDEDATGGAVEAYRHFWEITFDDWYDPFTVVGDYVDAVLDALVDMDEIEANVATVLRDGFAYAPLAVDQTVDDAVWDRIRSAVMGRRALRYGKASPAAPRQQVIAADEWESIDRRDS
jgi:hypothetical protein